MRNSKLAKLILAAVVGLGATAFEAAAQPSNQGYAQSGPAAATWKNPFGLCWRTGYWTPSMATAECDPDLVPKPAAAPVAPPPPVAKPAPAPVPLAKPAAPPKPTVITLKSTELFDFNKATLTPKARATIDSEVIAKLASIRNIRYINVNGHTDRLGSATYNQKLSERRADAVKRYMVSKGVDAAKIETYGFGKTLPIKACPDQKDRKALIECLAPNRRVEVEVQSGPQ